MDTVPRDPVFIFTHDNEQELSSGCRTFAFGDMVPGLRVVIFVTGRAVDIVRRAFEGFINGAVIAGATVLHPPIQRGAATLGF